MPIHGGPSHTRYDHRSRPTQVDVCCPACDALARAELPDEPPPVVGDLSRRWPMDAPQWRLACTVCPHRVDGLRWDALPRLYWRTQARGLELWAWNRAHLEFIHRHLAGAACEIEPYARLATYIPGAWKARREAVIRAMRRLRDDPARHRTP